MSGPTTASARPVWLTYELLERASQDGTWAIDAEERTVYADARMAEILGYASEEMIGRSMYEFMEPKWKAAATKNVERRRSGVAERHDFVLRHRDGHLVTVAMATAPGMIDGEYAGAVALVRDVTEQRAAERERDESMARLQAAFENLPFDFWIADTEGRCLAQNPVSLEVWGDQLGKTVDDGGYPPNVRVRLKDDLSRALGCEVVHYETVFELGPDFGNRSLALERIVAPILIGEKVAGVLGINVDISNRKQLEVALWRSHKLEAVGRLAGGVAHDFNNVLTAIMSAVALIQRRVKDDDLVGMETQIIRDASSRAADLTRKLLTFAQKQMVAPKRVSPSEMLLGIDRLIRRVIGEDIEVVTVPSDNDWRVEVDVSEFEHALVNLAVNARDAMPHGGTLTIRIENATVHGPRIVTTGALEPGEYVIVRVADTGEGIDPVVMARIFEPFFSTKGDAGGTGLGLASVHGAISQAGGEIDVISHPGLGTEFFIYLPRSVGDASAPRQVGLNDFGPTGNSCVLLVEDDPLVRATAARTLSSLGYRVQPCRDATDALAHMREHGNEIDVVVTDIVMPKMNGPALTRAIRETRPELPVLYMSGYPDDPRFTEELARPRVAFLPKPFTPTQLATALRILLDAA